MTSKCIYLAMGIVCVAGVLNAADSEGGGNEMKISLKQPLGEQGTVAFRMTTDKAYRGGLGQERVDVPLFEIPGLAKCAFAQNTNLCVLSWKWDGLAKSENLELQVPELPGPAPYYVIYTWDAKQGRMDAYLNGTALRVPGTTLTPWTLKPASEIVLAGGAIQIADVEAEPKSLSEKEAIERTPADLRGTSAELIGIRLDRKPLDVEGRRGALLYESKLDSPDSISGWVMEGPGKTKFADGWMEMSSERPDGPEGHLVHWCPKDFPANFVAEWEIQPISHYGLCIVFFAAKGKNGEDIFDPSLPKREGVFKQYHSEAINCYHISYYANTPDAPGRITSNLRKNAGFYLISNGPPGIAPGSKEAHQVRLIKDGGHLQLTVNGTVIIDYTDDGQRYGRVLDGGKIGLRQMQWMVAQYRNFRVWDLTPGS